MFKKTKLSSFVFLSLLVSTSLVAKEFLIVASSSAPFEYKNTSGKVVGMDIDLTKAIFSKMGIDVQFRILPWARAWDMIEKGKADASLTTSRKDKRKPFVFYPEEDLWTSEFTIFVNKNGKGKSARSYKDLTQNNIKVGVVKGYSYNDGFWQAFPNRSKKELHETLKVAVDLNTNFKKLDNNRIDAIVEDRIVGTYTYSKVLGLNNVKDTGAVVFSKGYPMAFSKKSSFTDIENIIIQYDKILKIMKKNGEYDAIKNTWLN
jgi:polar amino acid transport system substrate-binding protein